MNLQTFCTYFAVVLLSLLSVTGCQPQQREPFAPVIQTPVVAAPEILGYSVQNRPIEMFTIGYGPERVLIMATIHGDETAGLPLTWRLIDRLKSFTHLHDRYTVMVIPLANPDGLALGTRFNASGIDLNRNFPASNRINSTTFGLESLTEPESRVLHDLILDRPPARIVSIHQPLYCLDYDGPGEGIAEAMAVYCPLPVKKLGSRAGSFGSFCGLEQNIPIITMELAKEDSDLTEDQLWNLYGFSLLAAITYPELPF